MSKLEPTPLVNQPSSSSSSSSEEEEDDIGSEAMENRLRNIIRVLPVDQLHPTQEPVMYSAYLKKQTQIRTMLSLGELRRGREQDKPPLLCQE